jgi:uncharacterized membrane protein
MRKTTLWLCNALALMGLLVSAVVWTLVPSPMPIHWNASGQADGFGPKTLGLLLMPLMTLATTLLVTVLARRQKALGPGTRSALGVIMTAFAGFMLGIHMLMIHAALSRGMGLSMGLFTALFGALFLAIGVVMPRLEPNRICGVRTPWNMNNEANWRLTHRFAAYSMGGAGLLTIVVSPLLSPPALFVVSFSAIMLGSFAPVLVSYLLHRARS